MKKLSISIFLMFLCFRVSAQCPPAGDIILTSQAEVNNFQTLYGSCPNLVVNGDLVIIGADISSLLPLAGLKGVTGDLFIEDAEELTTPHLVGDTADGMHGRAGVGEGDGEVVDLEERRGRLGVSHGWLLRSGRWRRAGRRRGGWRRAR